eukprot:TRINITY_DN3088_c0_g1_i3.p1 TRINITY_DN3088_c0_g1~~TRINITY_DN3088_c0_g1_i3.p1  ORF type:complete len:582 (+),score=175.35 TRINITY_DN3088_c0_g1_i3:67-1812(+)
MGISDALSSCFGKGNAVQSMNKETPIRKKEDVLLFAQEDMIRNRWDILIFCTVVFICIVVPLRLGFLIMEWQYWLVMDIFSDVLLALDIVICTMTTFEVDGEVIKDRTTILHHYLRGWFAADLLSVFPFEFICLITRKYHPAYRANRLIRMGRLTYYFSQWEKVTSLKPSVIRIFKSTFVILFLAHFIGCAFFLVILIEGDNAKVDFTGTENILNRSLGSKYIRAFYWSFVTMTGYNNTNPHTQLETIFSIAVTMVGISLFATIIGTVGSLVTNLDSSALYFRQKMDGINDYMKYKRIPQDLQNEVRNYYTYLWKSGKGLDKNKVLDDLPPYLKNKMSVILNSEIIKKVPLFQQCKDDTEFINEIVKCLKPRVCLPNSFVVRKGEVGTEMFFISRGELNVVSDDDKVVFTLKDGGFFGEIALLYDTKRTASIVARTYCDMFVVRKGEVGTEMFFISRGELNVVSDDDKVVFTLKDGGFFGEIALLYDTKRTASIVARTYCDMFVLTKEDFKKVMKKFPTQSKGIKEIAKERFQSIVDAERQREQQNSERGNDPDDSNTVRADDQATNDSVNQRPQVSFTID